jgi:N-acetyl sugar amidotransferase
MTTTKPGIELNSDGLCQACVHHEMRKHADYEARFEQLEKLADKYRRDDGYYDCILPISGGKSSHFQSYIVTEELDLNPLFVRVADPFTKTEIGKQNLQNLREVFEADIITREFNPKAEKELVKTAFEELGFPLWPHERAIMTAPIRLAVDMNIPFVIYGEHGNWEYGGQGFDHRDEEPSDAKEQVYNQVVPDIENDFWTERGIQREDLNMVQYPTEEELDSVDIMPIWLSYYIPWDVYKSRQIAKQYGFRDLKHEWDREGYIDEFDQIDSVAYHMNIWLKYPKYGFGRVTDVVGYQRRSNLKEMSLEEGKKLIEEHDHKLDQRILDDFLDYTGYTDREFWKIVEEFRNDDLFDERFDEPSATPKDGMPVVNNDFENINLN